MKVGTQDALRIAGEINDVSGGRMSLIGQVALWRQRDFFCEPFHLGLLPES